MGRPLGSRNKIKNENGHEIGIGDNSEPRELTPEQKRSLLLQACQEIGNQKEQIASFVGEMRALYKAYKADGIPKKDIDFALSLRNMGAESVLDLVERNAQIIEWIHPGVQAEFSFDRAAE